MNIKHYFGTAAIAVAALVAPSLASATIVNWTQGGDFDNLSQTFAGITANTISFAGADASYGFAVPFAGPGAHTHGQTQTWGITAVIDGLSQTIFSETQASGAEQSTSLVALGNISFTQGLVTSIGFTCVSCSVNTFHQFSDTSFDLSVAVPPNAVPEPAVWALMLAGLGFVGVGKRRRQGTV
jgi:hypothetical protein